MDSIYYQDYPKLKCDLHEDCQLEYININLSQGRVVNCVDCVSENELNGSSLIPLIRLFKNDSKDLIQRFNFFTNKEIILQMKDDQSQELRKQLIIQVEASFNELSNSMNKMIDENKKKVIAHINYVAQKQEEYKNLVKESMKLKEIQNSFNGYSNNITQLNNKLKSNISSVKQEQENLQQLLLEQIEEYIALDQQVSLDHIKNMQTNLISIYQQFDYLIPKTKNVETQQPQQNQEINPIRNIPIEKEEGEERDLLPHIQAVQTKLDESNRCFINKLYNNHILIQNDSENYRHRQLYLDHILEKSKKYEIQVQFPNDYNYNIILGLLPTDLTDKCGWKFNLSLGTSLQLFGIEKVEKGLHFSKIYKEIHIIKFQICLDQKILKCVTQESDQEHIISLKDTKNLDKHNQYYFYVSSQHNNQSMEIISFKQVKQFTNL